MKRTSIMVSAALALSLGACKKDDKGGDNRKEPAAAKVNPCAGKDKQPPAEPDPLGHVPDDPAANFAVARVSHAEPKEGDPVHVVFKTIEVKRVAFEDPQNLEGATAEIHIALGDLDSGVPDRDKHLEAADFFDAASNPRAVIVVSGVKKAGDKKYNARAEVTAMGHTQTWPVSFEVEEVAGDSVRVKGTHKFKRSDFKIGEGVPGPADEVELELHLTLAKS